MDWDVVEMGALAIAILVLVVREVRYGLGAMNKAVVETMDRRIKQLETELKLANDTIARLKGEVKALETTIKVMQRDAVAVATAGECRYPVGRKNWQPDVPDDEEGR
jgi:cell division protein FtsB